MNIWENTVLTDKGRALLVKLVAGSSLHITRAATGTGYVTPGLLAQQTAVSGEKQALNFRPVGYPEEGKCAVTCNLTNDDLTAGYLAKQIGLYATDPDNGEILFMLSQAPSEKGTEVPSASEMPGYSAEWTFNIQYGQADGVTVVVDPANTVSFAEMEAQVNKHASNKNNPHGVTAEQVGAAASDKHNITTYTDLSQIGLTFGSETLESIASAMPDNSILQYAVNGGNTDVYPDDYGRMEVRRADADTVVFYFNNRSGWSVDEYAETYVCHARVYDGGASVTGWVKVFDGGSMPVNIFYGEGTGDQAAAYKDVTITQEGFALKKGVTIAVKFNNQNKAASPKLNVNGTGDIPVKQNGTVDVDTMTWVANQVVLFTYDGTNWLQHGAVRATVNGRVGPTSLSSATDSTAENVAATPAAVKAAYDLANGKANATHNQAASTITAGTLAGKVQANASAAATVTTAQVRDIYAGTSDLTAGTSSLTSGTLYFVYE